MRCRKEKNERSDDVARGVEHRSGRDEERRNQGAGVGNREVSNESGV